MNDIRIAAIMDRIEQKIAVNEHGCWIWTGATSSEGYPSVRMTDGLGKHRNLLIHRLVYEREFEMSPTNIRLGRACNTRLCVCPEHLVCKVRPRNSYVVKGSVALIGLRPYLSAKIDTTQMEVVRQHHWQVANTGYVVSSRGRSGESGQWLLHRLVTGVAKTEAPHIDHINGDKLDNRLCNLRPCTNSQNLASAHRLRSDNTTGYRGVSPAKHHKTKPWAAQITVKGKNIKLGYYLTPKDAARAYDEAASNHFGEFATLNFPLAEAWTR